MPKRDRKAVKPRGADDSNSVPPVAKPQVAHPPKKQPVMLAISVVLFALWLVFLFVTAVFG
jgi:hypothetical protein